MSIGYVKGKFWVPDERFAAYAARASYTALLKSVAAAGFAFNVEYSYTGRRYTAEIITIERFERSDDLYFVKHNNAYDENPMAAVSKAIRACPYANPLIRLHCLEIELELAAEAAVVAKRRDTEASARQAAAMEALTRVLDDLDRTLDSVEVYIHGTLFDRMSSQSFFDCEDCIGMKEHGCFCAAMGATAPGGPLPDEDDDL